MAIDDGNESKAEVGGGTDDLSDGVHPPRASLIKVSYKEDGSPLVDAAMVILYAGDRVVWHTASNEQRAFKLVFPEGFPVDHGSGHTVADAPSTESPTRAEYDGDIRERTFSSSPQQIAEATIRRDATPGLYDYEVRVEGEKGTPGVAFAGGVIIRPTGPRPFS
jgi:hypothetical protein